MATIQQRCDLPSHLPLLVIDLSDARRRCNGGLVTLSQYRPTHQQGKYTGGKLFVLHDFPYSI